MSQNGTASKTSENRASTALPLPVYVPMMPFVFPYNTDNSSRQAMYGSPIYTSLPIYSSTGGHAHPTFGYNPFYSTFYPNSTNMMSSAAHVSDSTSLMAPRQLMYAAPSRSQPSMTGLFRVGNEPSRNKPLEIRECTSPVIPQIEGEKHPPETVPSEDSHSNGKIPPSSSSSASLRSNIESNSVPPSTSSSSSSCSSNQVFDSTDSQEDFLTFLERKTKPKTTMPELNPLAREFSFGDTRKTTLADPLITTNGSEPTVVKQANSSYKLLFNGLIDQGLEATEALKLSTKKASVNHVSVQCNPIVDCLHRSTQTTDQIKNRDLLQKSSSRSIEIMDTLLGHFRHLYQHDLRHGFQAMAQSCDELRHLVLFIHQIIAPSDHGRKESPSIAPENPFHNMFEDVSKASIDQQRYRTSTQMTVATGRGARYFLSSSSSNNQSSVPSFSCRQVNAMPPVVKSKLCLLCHHPMDEDNRVMHELCQLLSAGPNRQTDA